MLTLTEISQATGLTRMAAYFRIKSRGITFCATQQGPGNRRPIHLYRDCTINMIMQKHPGRNRGSVPLTIRKNYLRDQDIVALRDSGVILSAIGESYKLSKERIRQICKKSKENV